MSIVFGPIPSRRLGRSLGINNIPPKICSYSCVYCQIGLTDLMLIDRKEFLSPDNINTEVSQRVNQLKKANEKIDYLTFVPDGEPTLDLNIGREIDLLKPLNIKIAVITNSSLLWDEQARKDLLKADLVSVKIDTVNENEWHKINRPNRKLKFQEIISGLKIFASDYKNKLLTETMLVKDINDSEESLNNTAKLISELQPDKAFILTPVRPPAEKFVESPSEEKINLAYKIFYDHNIDTNFLIFNEGTDFVYSSDAEKELLSILAVHPMRKDAVETFLFKAKTDWSLIESLIKQDLLKEINYGGYLYYLRKMMKKNHKINSV